MSLPTVHPGRLATLVLALALVHPHAARGDEGQWMPRQLSELDADALARMGLQLPLSQLHATDADGNETGLLAAIVNLSGCSAGFVSADGLIATNHHCAYAAIQAASSVEHDYLEQGLLAATHADEIPAKGVTVQVVESVTDVTAKIREAADAQQDPAARALAVDRVRKQLVAECEARPARRCRVADFYAGAEVQLIASRELTDVRLVYAPPSSVGNYGGEVDNWMWPRHTGDFTLLRAWVGKDGEPAPHAADNVPFRPQRFLPLGAQGVGPGDFIAVLGFPGSTQRYQSAAEVARHVEQVFPARVDLYGEWIAILEAAGAGDKAVAIKVAAKLKGLANRHKNALGMLDGLRRNRTTARREQEQAELDRWCAERTAAADPAATGCSDTFAQLRAVSDERRAAFAVDFLVDNLDRGANALAIAIDVVRRASERRKPDLERVDDYMDRKATELWSTQARRVRDFDPAVDRALLQSLLRRVAALPAADRFTPRTEADVTTLLRTRVNDEGFVKSLWDADWEVIARERDPMIAFARTLLPAIEAAEARDRAREGIMLQVGPRYFAALDAVRTGPVYPDANGTLRLSFATVQGYSPREGLLATPQTTVTGLLDKHTGTPPFDAPQALRDAAPAAASSRFADARLHDVPVALLGNADTTGGNSGSPVIDGQGRWVGLNFDRVWENIAGDFGYSPERSRNVMVDVRYLLWNLESVAHADALLRELGVEPVSASSPAGADSAPAAPATAEPASTPAELGVPKTPAHPRPLAPAAAGCGCASAAPPGAATMALPFLIAAAAWWRRRRPAVRGGGR